MVARAGFFNPYREYQPGIAIVDSVMPRVLNNSSLLSAETQLPFTNNIYMVQQIAQ